MPLGKGTSRAVVSANIAELVDDWKRDGALGTSHPRTKRKAVRQAVAIALETARRSKPVARRRKAV